MDGSRFDGITKTLMATSSRRGAVHLMAASALAIGLTWPIHEAAAACNKTGKKCKRDKQCCSGHCRRGKCRCSNAGGECTSSADCCGDLVCLRIGAVCAVPA